MLVRFIKRFSQMKRHRPRAAFFILAHILLSLAAFQFVFHGNIEVWENNLLLLGAIALGLWMIYILLSKTLTTIIEQSCIRKNSRTFR